jgi:hypothetical protein
VTPAAQWVIEHHRMVSPALFVGFIVGIAGMMWWRG